MKPARLPANIIEALDRYLGKTPTTAAAASTECSVLRCQAEGQARQEATLATEGKRLIRLDTPTRTNAGKTGWPGRGGLAQDGDSAQTRRQATTLALEARRCRLGG
jgi:hypothetical protein